MKGFIYKIVNCVNKRVYIGSTRHEHIAVRWYHHKKDMMRKTTPLYQAMKEIGVKKFKILLVEKIEFNKPIELMEREREWQIKFNSVKNGYNQIHAPRGKEKVWHENTINCIKYLFMKRKVDKEREKEEKILKQLEQINNEILSLIAQAKKQLTLQSCQ